MWPEGLGGKAEQGQTHSILTVAELWAFPPTGSLHLQQPLELGQQGVPISQMSK